MKITRSGGRQYLQLVEGLRNEEGKFRHRVVANLGRLEDLNRNNSTSSKP